MAAPRLLAKPTRYRDRLGREWFFRSRLEARRAVFCDVLGISYVFEPEKYRVNGLVYMPDFQLKDLCCWLEVKPDEPDLHEREKARQLARHNQIVLIAGGSCNPTDKHVAFIGDLPGEATFRFVECQECQRIGVLLFQLGIDEKRPIFICPTSTRHRAAWPAPSRLAAAYGHAQAYRFEEQP